MVVPAEYRSLVSNNCQVISNETSELLLYAADYVGSFRTLKRADRLNDVVSYKCMKNEIKEMFSASWEVPYVV